MLAARKSVAKVPGVFDNFYPHSPLPSPLPQYYNLSSQRHKCRYSVSIAVHVQSIFNSENDTFTVS